MSCYSQVSSYAVPAYYHTMQGTWNTKNSHSEATEQNTEKNDTPQKTADLYEYSELETQHPSLLDSAKLRCALCSAASNERSSVMGGAELAVCRRSVLMPINKVNTTTTVSRLL